MFLAINELENEDDEDQYDDVDFVVVCAGRLDD